MNPVFRRIARSLNSVSVCVCVQVLFFFPGRWCNAFNAAANDYYYEGYERSSPPLPSTKLQLRIAKLRLPPLQLWALNLASSTPQLKFV